MLKSYLTHEPSPHGLALLADEAHQFRWLPWGLRQELATLWSPSRVGALSTPTLLEELAAHDVRVDRGAFVGVAEGRDRAWSIAEEVWLPQARGDVPDCLLGLAAVELWKRWLPERPSREVLGSWIAEGYRLLETNRRVVCERWLQTWDVLRWRIGRRPTLESVGQLIDGGPPPERWLFDLARELCVVVVGAPEVGPRAVAFCREVLARLKLKAEDAFFRERIEAFLADMLFHLGDRKGGEALYREMISRGHGVTTRMWLADALAYGANAATGDEIARAIAVLKPVPDYGVGLGPEAEALDRLGHLRAHPPLQPADAVARLLEVGRHLPEILAQRILAAGDAVVPDLLALVERSIGADEESVQSLAAGHAISLLGRMRASEAIGPIIRCLAGSEPYHRTEAVCVGALKEMGATALEPLLEAYAVATEADQRRPLRNALSGLNVRDQRIFELILESLDESPSDAGLDLWEYGDEQAIPILRHKLDGLEDSDYSRALRSTLADLQDETVLQNRDPRAGCQN